MTDQHPITIPPDLEEELLGLWPQESLQRAARWGWQQRDASVADELQEARDEELEECCEWLRQFKPPEGYVLSARLRTHRRFKPKSLAEEALDRMDEFLTAEDQHIIRRALERLQELEGQSDD